MPDSTGTLPPAAFGRHDETPDADFYRAPRLVTHIDEAAVAAVTELYREFFPTDGTGRILDLMSSWVSHLPPEVTYARVAGLGMNAAELAANPRLTEWRVQDLNAYPVLPYGDAGFDGCGICVSVQYLTRPVDVMREVGRVLVPGAPLVVTFSNRCFPTKAVAAWRMTDDADHLRLVGHYLDASGAFSDISLMDRSPAPGRSDPLLAVVGRRRKPG
jgi:SAM-dependent methyltransferase